MDHLKEAKRNIIAAQSIRADAGAEPVTVLAALSQTAIANALIALVEGLDRMTDGEEMGSTALRVNAWKEQ